MKKFLAVFSALVSIMLLLFIFIALFWTTESSILAYYLVSIFWGSLRFLILILFFWISAYITVGLFIQVKWISIREIPTALQERLIESKKYTRMVWLIIWTSAIFLILFFWYYYHLKSLEDLKDSYRQEKVQRDIQNYINAPLHR